MTYVLRTKPQSGWPVYLRETQVGTQTTGNPARATQYPTFDAAYSAKYAQGVLRVKDFRIVPRVKAGSARA